MYISRSLPHRRWRRCCRKWFTAVPLQGDFHCRFIRAIVHFKLLPEKTDQGGSDVRVHDRSDPDCNLRRAAACEFAGACTSYELLAAVHHAQTAPHSLTRCVSNSTLSFPQFCTPFPGSRLLSQSAPHFFSPPAIFNSIAGRATDSFAPDNPYFLETCAHDALSLCTLLTRNRGALPYRPAAEIENCCQFPKSPCRVREAANNP